MEFSDNKPIYRQIADHACDMIIGGKWTPGMRVPSVRELAVELGVNTRTVLKAMEYLQEAGVISPRRGMGFILTEDAPFQVVRERRREFFESTLPALRTEMERLGISRDELIESI